MAEGAHEDSGAGAMEVKMQPGRSSAETKPEEHLWDWPREESLQRNLRGCGQQNWEQN